MWKNCCGIFFLHSLPATGLLRRSVPEEGQNGPRAFSFDEIILPLPFISHLSLEIALPLSRRGLKTRFNFLLLFCAGTICLFGKTWEAFNYYYYCYHYLLKDIKLMGLMHWITGNFRSAGYPLRQNFGFLLLALLQKCFRQLQKPNKDLCFKWPTTFYKETSCSETWSDRSILFSDLVII